MGYLVGILLGSLTIALLRLLKRLPITEMLTKAEIAQSSHSRVHFPGLEDRYLNALTHDVETAAILGRRLELLVADYVQRGQLADADSLYRRAMAIRDNLFQESPPEVADALQSLGQWLLAQGRAEDGQTACQRAAAIRRRLSDPPSAEQTPGLSNS